MEQWFRIALCMTVLTGHLYSAPVCTFKMESLDFKDLRELSCNAMNIQSPTNVTSDCYTAALQVFIEKMEQAMPGCTDEDNRIGQVLDALNNSACVAQKKCDFTWTVHQQFAGFVNATETFVQQLNVHGH